MIPHDITNATFLDTYWHRATLADFCRVKGLPSSGSKSTLTAHISDHLSGKTTLQ